jgi:sarcosine oxidase
VWDAKARLFTPATVSAHLSLAAGAGADLRFGQNVLGWEGGGGGSAGDVAVTTATATFRAERLVLAGRGLDVAGGGRSWGAARSK